jgi:hypothetical protein
MILQDNHEVLNSSFDELLINKSKPILLKTKSNKGPQYSLIYRYIFIIISVGNILFHIARLKPKGGFIIVREFWNIPFLIISPFLFHLRRSIFLNINHNLKNIQRKFPTSLLLLSLIGFRFILLDGTYAKGLLPFYVRKNFYFPPFLVSKTISSVYRNKTKKNKITIGVVGDFRLEKLEISYFLMLMKKIIKNPKFNLKIGVRNKKIHSHLLAENLNIFPTENKISYQNFLASIDVLIIFASKNAYYVRHSGTIMDAITYSVIPIAPDFPVFRSQILQPKQVGFLYKSTNQIYTILDNISIRKINFFKERVEYIMSRRFSNLTVDK